jgi:hypothetical protein
MYQSLSLRKKRERCQKTMKDRKIFGWLYPSNEKIILGINEFIF